MCESMAKTSFTVHLDQETAEKVELMKDYNPEFSRNGLIRLAIKEYSIHKQPETVLEEEIYALKHCINALHKQNNPDWKRKKSLPYHYADEYAPILNYTSYHGE